MITWLDQEPFIFTNGNLLNLTQFGYQANKETEGAHQAQLRFVSKCQHQVSTAQWVVLESRAEWAWPGVTGGDTLSLEGKDHGCRRGWETWNGKSWHYGGHTASSRKRPVALGSWDPQGSHRLYSILGQVRLYQSVCVHHHQHPVPGPGILWVSSVMGTGTWQHRIRRIRERL